MYDDSVRLEAALPEDATAIAGLAESIWHDHYPSIIGVEQIEYMLDLMYSSASIQEQMENGQQFYFVTINGERIGYISVSSKAGGELMLHKFYINTEVQGRGVGFKAFHALLTMIPTVEKIRLTVNRKNYKSINFYFRLGFKIEEVKDFDIGNGFLMEDFVMKWERIVQ